MMQKLFSKKDKSAAAALDKKSIVQVAKNGGAQASNLEVVIDGSEDDVLPWHAVHDANEVVQDLASNVEDGLSSGEGSEHRQIGVRARSREGAVVCGERRGGDCVIQMSIYHTASRLYGALQRAVCAGTARLARLRPTPALRAHVHNTQSSQTYSHTSDIDLKACRARNSTDRTVSSRHLSCGVRTQQREVA